MSSWRDAAVYEPSRVVAKHTSSGGHTRPVWIVYFNGLQITTGLTDETMANDIAALLNEENET